MNFGNSTANDLVVTGTLSACTAPSITSVSSNNSPICADGTLNLNAIATDIYTLSYLWSGTGVFSSNNSATSDNTTVTGAATGSYTVTVTNSCLVTASSNTSVTVYPLSDGGTVSSSTTVCSGINGGTLTLGTHTGNVVRWESSLDNFATAPTVIVNTTTSQVYSNLTQTTSYRAVVQSGVCATAASVAATITVDPATVGGSVAASATVCANGNSGTLNLTGHTGNVVRWESSLNNFSTAPTVISNTTTSQSYLNLTQTTYYRAVIQSGVCATAASSVATITVITTPISGAVNQIIDLATGLPIDGACSGVVFHVQANGAVTGTGLYYSWNKGTSSGDMQFSNNVGGPWQNGPFATTPGAGSNQVYVKFGALVSGYSKYQLCVQGVTFCGNSTANFCYLTRATVSTPSGITPASGSNIVCTPGPGATNASFTAGTVGGAYQYRWTFPGMADQVIVGTPIATLPIPVFATTGSLCVFAELSCGATSHGPASCITLSHQLAAVGTMGGITSACPASTTPYSIPMLTGASNYTWSAGAGCTINDGVQPVGNPYNYIGIECERYLP